jgi:hypothetical protein
MTPREYDESDVRIRPTRTTRRRSKDRPSHSDSHTALVISVDRGRSGCMLEDGPNAGQVVVNDEIEPTLRDLCEDVIRNRNNVNTRSH